MNANNRPEKHQQDSPQSRATVSGCCGGPAPVGTSACCAEDAAVKSAGGAGCGCESTPIAAAPAKKTCC